MMTDTGVKKLIELFKDYGHTVYTVGGCVRDSIMQRPVSDYDIAVPTAPDKTEAVLTAGGIRYFETGLQHGTVTALVDGITYELTTFRTDGAYTDNRRPDTVHFVSRIENDLARRDFTINAMAYNPDTGIVDMFGGMSDIEKRIIRTVGDADTRFEEDALRILRGLRFASVLGFDIEKKTASSIIKKTSLLSHIALERITVELQKLLVGQRAGEILYDFSSVFCHVCPHFSKIYEKHARDELIYCVSELPLDADVRLALLCYFACSDSLTEKSEIIARIFKCFKLKNDSKNKILALVLNMDRNISCERAVLKRALGTLGEKDIFDLVALRSVTEKRDYADVLKMIKDIIGNNEAYKVSQLAVTGNDIKALGIKGKAIGDILERILELVITDRLENDKQKIIEIVKLETR